MVTRESSEVRDNILDAALHVFSEKGYEAATVRQISAQSSANIALISYYFGGKEQLFFELIGRSFPRFAPWDAKEDPVVALRELIATMIRFKLEHSCLANMIHQEVSMYSARKAGLAVYVEPLVERLSGILVTGAEQGLFQISHPQVIMSCVTSIILVPEELTVCPNAKISSGGCLASVTEVAVQFILNGLKYQAQTESAGN
jgi:AcrR family transcriptional regulator